MSIDITSGLRVDPNGPRMWRVVQIADDLIVGEIIEEGTEKFTRYGKAFAYRVGTFTTLAAATTLETRQDDEYGQDFAQAEADEMNSCEGHESFDGAHMGETVYCDGSCV